MTIDNTGGDQGILISDISISGANAAEFSLNLPYTLPITLPPGQTFQFDIDLTPVSSGSLSALLSIAHTGTNDTIKTPLLANAATTFPVELLGFRAEAVNGSVHLSWETASERNSDYFGIERSIDGYMFEEFDRVDAMGFSSEWVNYQVIDEYPLKGKSYYRLRQVDLDGSMTHSSVVAISVNTSSFKVFPNPIDGRSKLHVYACGLPDEGGFLRIRNAIGQEIFGERVQISEGRLERDLQLHNLPPGMYIIQLESDNTYTSLSKTLLIR